MKQQELNLLDGYTPTNDLLNDAKQIIENYKKEYQQYLGSTVRALISAAFINIAAFTNCTLRFWTQ